YRFASRSMFRSLHVQLVTIVVCTVTAVLVATQVIDSHFEVRAVEQDLRERAELVLHTVDSLWGSAPPDALRDTLEAMVKADREVPATDVFRLRSGTAQVEVSTRRADEPGVVAPTADQVAQIVQGTALAELLPSHEHVTGYRLSVPLIRDGAV